MGRRRLTCSAGVLIAYIHIHSVMHIHIHSVIAGWTVARANGDGGASTAAAGGEVRAAAATVTSAVVARETLVSIG